MRLRQNYICGSVTSISSGGTAAADAEHSATGTADPPAVMAAAYKFLREQRLQPSSLRRSGLHRLPMVLPRVPRMETRHVRRSFTGSRRCPHDCHHSARISLRTVTWETLPAHLSYELSESEGARLPKTLNDVCHSPDPMQPRATVDIRGACLGSSLWSLN